MERGGLTIMLCSQTRWAQLTLQSTLDQRMCWCFVCTGQVFVQACCHVCVFFPNSRLQSLPPLRRCRHTHTNTEDSAKPDHVAESTSQKITIPLWARLFDITSGSDHISGSRALAYLLSAEWRVLSDVTQWPSLWPLLLSFVPQSD